MAYRWFLNPKWLVIAPLLAILIAAVACGGDDATEEEVTSPDPTSTSTPQAMTDGQTPEPTPTAMAMATPDAPPADEIKFGGIVPMQGYAAVVPRIFHRLSIPVLHGIYGDFSHLIVYDPETPEPNDVVCDLCSDWEVSDDGLVYTFRLRENAVWSDGTPLTSRDMIFTLDSIMQPDTIPILKEAAQSIPTQEFPIYQFMQPGSYEAPDDFTVVMNLDFPSATFPVALANNNNIIVAAHKVLDEGILQGTVTPEDLVMSGPFLLEEWDLEVVWKSRRNDNYYKEGYPRIDGIDSFIIVDKGNLIAAFKTEQIMMFNAAVNNLNFTETEQMVEEEQGKLVVHFAGPSGMRGVVFNASKAPFDQLAMRRAVHYAMHRQAIIQSLGGRDSLGTPFPPDTPFTRTTEEVSQIPGYRETADGEKHPDDIAIAKQILEDAGLSGELEVQLTTRNCCQYPESATVLADQLRRFLGWDVDLRIMESAAGYDAYSVGDVQFFVQGSGLSLIDPNAYMDRYISENTFARWADGGVEGAGRVVPGMDELFQSQKSLLDMEARIAIVREAEDKLMNEDVFYDGIYWTTRSWVLNSRIKGFNMHPLIYAYNKHDQIWCDPAC
jgi:ABC-type transport system substrate-binding protein